MFPWYHNDSNHKCYQILNGTVGIRKYFNNEYTKWYVGIYCNTGYFDLSMNEEKWIETIAAKNGANIDVLVGGNASQMWNVRR